MPTTLRAPIPARPPRRAVRAATTTVGWLVLLASVTACTSSGSGGTGTGYITGDGVVTTIAPSDRQPVPHLSGDALGGGTVDLADHRGDVVVLNVWASWCPPCRAEAPELVAAAKQLPQASFVGIDTRDANVAAAEAFVRKSGIPYDSIYDPDGSAMLAFYGLLAPSSLPSTLVVDDAGRIAALVLGPVTASTLVGLVRDVEATA